MATSSISIAPVVLIVDDYADTIEMYAAYLDLAGFRTVKAGNGQEALRLAFAELPDVILMDLSLPGIDGFEVTRRLKNDPATCHIPVIALTAHAAPQQFAEMVASGFDDLVIKPCLPDVLADLIERLLKRSGDRHAEGRNQAGTTRSAA